MYFLRIQDKTRFAHLPGLGKMVLGKMDLGTMALGKMRSEGLTPRLSEMQTQVARLRQRAELRLCYNPPFRN